MESGNAAGEILSELRDAGDPLTKKTVESFIKARAALMEQSALTDEPYARMRRLDVQPGGEVAWHSHEDRPALIYVVSGTITEYSSHCAVPIVHKTGELSVEQAGLSHWWKNTSKHPVVLISADIAADPKTPGM